MKVVPDDTSAGSGRGHGMPRANVGSFHVEQVNLVVHKVIVVVTLPELGALLLGILDKPGLDPNLQIAFLVRAIMPQPQRFPAGNLVQMRPPIINCQHAGVGKRFSK